MRIAVAQINTTLGDFSGNSEKIKEGILNAKDRHCDLVVFPESALLGYHPFDLLERSEIVDEQLSFLKTIQEILPQGMAVVFGLITKNKAKRGRPFFNSAVLLQYKKKPRFFNKQLLPTGDVFDEGRFIEAGNLEKNVFKFKKKNIFVTICEDIWAWPDSNGKSNYSANPLGEFKFSKIDLVLNLSASPYFPGKLELRKKLVKKTAQKFKSPIVYCNLVGAQDEIIFDGSSFAVDAKGQVLMQSLAFQEEFNIFDLSKMEGGLRSADFDEPESIRQALVLGIRDFCRKSGLKKVHLGLSGGVDSALVACLAVDALGPQAVSVFALPTQFNAEESQILAQNLAKNLGVSFLQVPIQPIFEIFQDQINEAFDIKEFGLVHENLQARIRGTLLMAYANHKNSLLLTTSNKTEYACGYSTLYGDMCGGLAPIGDLTKCLVYKLCEIYNAEIEIIPKLILTRPPSAELRPNQKDQDSLPEYSILDESVVRIVENANKPITKVDHWLLAQVMKTEFKRWQAPPILKVSSHSFGRGRRWPIAHRFLK